MKSILLLEDDENLNKGICLKLEKEGYRILAASRISQAVELLESEAVDLVICDITLPDGNGLDFGKMVRQRSDAILIYLTAMDQEIDIVNGYDAGADDYITKPFSVNILTSKVNAFMRRVHTPSQGILMSGNVEVSTRDLWVKNKGEMISLSKTEMQLLVYLMENAGWVLSKDRILEQVWGLEGQFVDDNTVTVNISRLKSKLGTGCIANVRGLGYLWTENVSKK